MEFRLPSVSKRLRVHTKTIVPPRVALSAIFQAMRDVYTSAAIDVEWASNEVLDLPHLSVLEIGNGCKALRDLSEEQIELFGHRNHANEELVVYFVEATIPVLNGCAAHPEQRPGAVVASIATEWTMAHEIGHVLGLRHVNNTDGLMTGAGTTSITNPPPDLDSSESEKLAFSPLVGRV